MLAVTELAALRVKVQLAVFAPPLLQAPDQNAVRPPEAVSLIEVPAEKLALPVDPTLTLIPAGVGAEDWRMDNTGPGGGFGLINPDSDDSPAGFVFNNQVLFPSDPSCGASSNPCAYDGSKVVNSGVPISSTSFAVTINANPGTSFWVLCLIHSMMETRITVVANNATTTTQSDINNYLSSTLSTDRGEAKALIPKLEKQTRHKIAAHRYVWDAYAGFDGDGWGLDAMFPKTLHIKQGQVVRWHFSQLQGNVHTVTFPRRRALNIHLGRFDQCLFHQRPGGRQELHRPAAEDDVFSFDGAAPVG